MPTIDPDEIVQRVLGAHAPSFLFSSFFSKSRTFGVWVPSYFLHFLHPPSPPSPIVSDQPPARGAGANGKSTYDWHLDDEAFDEKLAATAAPAPSAGERRNRELRQQMPAPAEQQKQNQNRGGGYGNDHHQKYIASTTTKTTRHKASGVPNLGLERLRARDKGWFGTLFASCEDEHEDGSYCGFRQTTRAIHRFFFDEPPAEHVDAFGFKIEEWDKAEMDRARATRRRWQCLRLVFLFIVITAVVAGSVFVDEVASKEKVMASEQQAAFEARIEAKVG